jgi:glycosyltransferase involved in cell wall biosynthesis
MAHRTRIAVVNYPFDADVADADALLRRYVTLTDWSEAIAAAGVSITVVQRFHREARFARNGVEYVFCVDGDQGHPRSRLWPGRLHQTVGSLQPDLVHVNGLNVPLQTWLLRRVLPSSTALVVQDHGGGVNEAGWLRLSVKRVAMRAADAFFFTAAARADAWRHAGLIGPDQRVHQVLEASTKMGPMDRTAAREESRVAGNPAILWVGRLNVNKSPLTVLDGFERSLSRLPDAVLTMVYGTDDLLPAVEQRLQASSVLAGRVRLVGAVPHDRMAAFYSAADVFVVGSHHEGSGYALIEACACGVPSVVTDIPSFRVITDGGSIGALWPTDDAARLAGALVEVAQRDRTTSRQRVLDHFGDALSWAAVARQATGAYAEVLADADRRTTRG